MYYSISEQQIFTLLLNSFIFEMYSRTIYVLAKRILSKIDIWALGTSMLLELVYIFGNVTNQLDFLNFTYMLVLLGLFSAIFWTRENTLIKLIIINI